MSEDDTRSNSNSRRTKRTLRDSVVATLKGEKPNRLPFIDRLEIWYESHTHAGTLPEEFSGMSLTEVHRMVGMGQEKFINAYSLKLRGVEMVLRFEGETLRRETDPVLNYFPHVADLVPDNQPGTTVTEFHTPLGTVSVQHQTLENMIAAGMEAYMKGHLIKEESDYRIVEYIVKRLEYVPQYDEFHEEEAKLGDIGFVVPLLQRIPFQQTLLEYLGEVSLFEALYDSPRHLKRLLALLDEQLTDILYKLSESPFLYVEFVDNLHGEMTNPKLFSQYCLPYYQRYVETLHGQGKKVGSHTDGDLYSDADPNADPNADRRT